MAINHIEFGFSVLHEGSDVLHETFYMTALQQSSIPVLGHSFCITEAGVSVTFNTSLNIAKQYLHIPLQFLVTMNLIQSQGKPFNQRLVMDKAEMNVRLLMDLNRYRPQKVPERSTIIPIQIVHPLRVTSSVREVTADLSVLSMSVRNVHGSVRISIDDVIFHTDRMAQSVVEMSCEQSVTTSSLVNLFHIALLNQKESDRSLATTINRSRCPLEIVVLPKEEYTFLYSISLRDPSQMTSLRDISQFATPVTLYWSVYHDGLSNGGKDSVVSDSTGLHNANNLPRSFQSELDCVVSWTIGRESCVRSVTDQVIPASSVVNAGNAFHMTLHGPTVVTINEKFVLRVCLTNRSAKPIPAPVLHAYSRCWSNSSTLCFFVEFNPVIGRFSSNVDPELCLFPILAFRICGSSHSRGQYVAHETVTQIG